MAEWLEILNAIKKPYIGEVDFSLIRFLGAAALIGGGIAC